MTTLRLWTDDSLRPIRDTDDYTDADGVQHLAQRDKASIPGLRQVTPTPRPDESPVAYTADGQPRGGVVVTGWHNEMLDGVPVQVWDTQARPELTEEEAVFILEDARDRALTQVRAGANAARDAWRTPGKDGVYVNKLNEGRAWVAAGQPEELTDYPNIAAEVGPDTTAPTAGALVALWEGMNDLWTKQVQPVIEGTEQRALKAITAAGSHAEVDAILAGLVWPTP